MATRTPIATDTDADRPDPEEERRKQIERNQGLIALLEEWLNEDDPEVIREQQETGAYLMRVLDEDRPSYRKLFP